MMTIHESIVYGAVGEAMRHLGRIDEHVSANCIYEVKRADRPTVQKPQTTRHRQPTWKTVC